MDIDAAEEAPCISNMAMYPPNQSWALATDWFDLRVNPYWQFHSIKGTYDMMMLAYEALVSIKLVKIIHKIYVHVDTSSLEYFICFSQYLQLLPCLEYIENMYIIPLKNLTHLFQEIVWFYTPFFHIGKWIYPSLSEIYV